MIYLQAARFILFNGDAAYFLLLSLVTGVLTFVWAFRTGALASSGRKLLFVAPATMLVVFLGWGVAWMPTAGRNANPIWAAYVLWFPLVLAPILSVSGFVRFRGARFPTGLFGLVNSFCCLFLAMVTYMAVTSNWL